MAINGGVVASLIIVSAIVSTLAQDGKMKSGMDDERDPQIQELGSGDAMELRECNMNTLNCWCIDAEGNPIEESRTYGEKPDCSEYNTYSGKTELPTRQRSTPAAVNLQAESVVGSTTPPRDNAATTVAQRSTLPPKQDLGITSSSAGLSWQSHLGIRVAIICAGVLGFLLIIAAIFFIVYRIRKKDEGSYPLTDSVFQPSHDGYMKAQTQEFFA